MIRKDLGVVQEFKNMMYPHNEKFVDFPYGMRQDAILNDTPGGVHNDEDVHQLPPFTKGFNRNLEAFTRDVTESSQRRRRPPTSTCCNMTLFAI